MKISQIVGLVMTAGIGLTGGLIVGEVRAQDTQEILQQEIETTKQSNSDLQKENNSLLQENEDLKLNQSNGYEVTNIKSILVSQGSRFLCNTVDNKLLFINSDKNVLIVSETYIGEVTESFELNGFIVAVIENNGFRSVYAVDETAKTIDLLIKDKNFETFMINNFAVETGEALENAYLITVLGMDCETSVTVFNRETKQFGQIMSPGDFNNDLMEALILSEEDSVLTIAVSQFVDSEIPLDRRLFTYDLNTMTILSEAPYKTAVCTHNEYTIKFGTIDGGEMYSVAVFGSDGVVLAYIPDRYGIVKESNIEIIDNSTNFAFNVSYVLDRSTITETRTFIFDTENNILYQE